MEIFLTTERLALRNVQPGDAEMMYDYRNNPICARYQRGQTRDRDGIVSLIERHKEDSISADGNCLVAVALRDTNEMVGEIVVMPNEGAIALGYTFSYRHHRKGYGFEALSALTKVLHEKFPGWDFICFTEPENLPSMALLRKLGYQDMGYLPSKASEVFGKWLTPETVSEIQAAVEQR